MFRAALLLALSSLLLSANVSAQEQETRTWKAGNGKYSVKAKLVEEKGDSIVLEKENGKRITVKLKSLSIADQRFVEGGKKGSSQRKKQRGSGPMDYRSVVTLKAEKAIPWRTLVANTASKKQVELKSPTSLPVEGLITGRPFNKLLGNPLGDKLLLVCKNKAAKTEVSSSETETTSTKSYSISSDYNELHVYDLTSAESKPSRLRLPASCDPLTISDDNRSLIVVPGSGARGNVVWLNPSGAGVRERLVWQYTPGHRAVLIFAQFVDDGMLVTADSMGFISMWDLHARLLLWQIQSQSELVPAISPDLKTLVSCNDEYLFQVDLQKGEVVSSLPVRINEPTCFGFHPDGKQLILHGSNMTRRIDLSNGKTIEQWNCIGSRRASVMCWPNDHQFLIFNHGGNSVTIFDLRLRGRIGNYGGMDGIAFDGRNRLWCLTTDVLSKSAIQCVEAPHDYYSKWSEQQEPDDYVLIKPGDAVRLDVSAVVHDATDAQIERIREIQKDASQKKGGRRGSRAGSPDRNLDKGQEQLNKTLRNVAVDSIDCYDEVYEMMAKKLEAAGLVISDSAKFTVHVEIGHPEKITTVNGEVSRTHPSFAIKYHAFATDSRGKRIWKTRSHSYSALDRSEMMKYATATPDAIKYLEQLDFPSHFVEIHAPGYSHIDGNSVIDKDYER